ncbi:MAG: asparaginase domain-containing protein [Actinomycetota bacterium]|nr:asparaginase domain-containing protein [Actinomycetota bacterium]
MVVAAPVTVIIATGGTIASRPSDAGVVSSVSGEELASAVPGLADEGSIEVQDLMNVNAFRIQALEILEIARAARSAAGRPDVGGVVVTHGTDTMEESAYLTDLLFDGDEPIVFTGAQRHAGSPGADGPASLLGAVRLARAPAARGLGAVVAFEGRVDAVAGWLGSYGGEGSLMPSRGDCSRAREDRLRRPARSLDQGRL